MQRSEVDISINARPVTLKECHEWLKKHESHTWSHNRKVTSKRPYLAIKYIEFGMDTRDWVVWKITGSGTEEFSVTTHDEFDGTILELLEERLGFNAPEA